MLPLTSMHSVRRMSQDLSALAALVCSCVPCVVFCSELAASACAACRLADAPVPTANHGKLKIEFK